MAAVTLNTTDYAVLGLLNRQPWSAYELTQYMRTSYIRAVWPRAESRLYESPKKLAANGYATVSTAMNGKRQRATYTITEAGITELNAWLREPGKGFSFEYEAMLKLCFGDIEDENLQGPMFENIMQQSQSDADLMSAFFKRFGEGAFKNTTIERAAQNLLVNAYIKEIVYARNRWTNIAKDFQERWDACEGDEEKETLVATWYQNAAEEKS